MKRKMVTFGIIILLLVGFNVTEGFAKEIKASSSTVFDDNILYVGGSGPNNYTIIQDAIDDASDGDTIFVYDDSAPYYEHNITIDKSINLIGEDRNTTIIYGINTSNTIIVNSKSNLITGFKIINGSHAILSYSAEIEISSNTILYNKGSGISISEKDKFAGGFCNIKNNDVSYNNNGISLYDVDGYIINVSDNILTNNDVGIGGSAIFNSIFTNNFIQNNSFAGFLFMYCSNCTIQNNHIINNKFGLECGFLFNNIIRYNNICKNILGLSLLGCGGNFIINNNFLDNMFSAVFIRQPLSELHFLLELNIQFNDYCGIEFYRILSRNTWDGNYWNRDRILPFPILGRIFGSIPWFNFDWHPASEPYDIEV